VASPQPHLTSPLPEFSFSVQRNNTLQLDIRQVQAALLNSASAGFAALQDTNPGVMLPPLTSKEVPAGDGRWRAWII